MTALELAGLTVSFPAGRTRTEVIHGLDLSLPAGSTLGVVGESGSGKSVTLRALMGLLPGTASVDAGTLTIDDRPAPLSGRGVRRSRRRRLAMVFQDPLAALDPVMSIGEQIAEVPRRVFGESRRAARTQAVDLLRQVRLPDPERRAAAYPHELSGGQRQRALVAMALACRPQILLCDEPTTALDVTTQAEVLDLLREIRERSHLSMIFVSHDLAVVRSMADDILVMRSGRPVETGPTARVVDRPAAPYTRQLLDAALELPEPPAGPMGAVEGEERRSVDAGGRGPRPPFLSARGITVDHPGVRALDRVDLDVAAAGIHGLVGESGSGKTTLATVLTGQLRPDAGEVRLDGQVLPPDRTRPQLRRVQMVFQDPYASLDPRMTVRQTLGELLRQVAGLPRPAVEARSVELLDQVSLPASALDRYPGQFSGGQRQRIAIARALAVAPAVLVADEPTSALDVSVQAAVLDLLTRLRDELRLTIVLISHNLAVVRRICDDVSVLRDGVVVDSGTVAEVLDHPRTAYTRQLIDAVPRLRKAGA